MGGPAENIFRDCDRSARAARVRYPDGSDLDIRGEIREVNPNWH